MKHKPHRRPGKPRVSPSVLERINLNAAGADCGSAAHFVFVTPDRDPPPVQSFKTFTSDLLRLADWAYRARRDGRRDMRRSQSGCLDRLRHMTRWRRAPRRDSACPWRRLTC